MYQAQHKVISHRWTLNKVKSFLVYIRFSFLTNVLLSATGNLLRLLGNNPVQAEGETSNFPHWQQSPRFIAPVHWHAYFTGPTATGQISAGQINFVAVPTIYSTPTPPKPIQCTLRRPQATATMYYLMSLTTTFKSIFFVVFATSFQGPFVRLVTSPYMRLRQPRGSSQVRQNLIQGTVTGHRSPA